MHHAWLANVSAAYQQAAGHSAGSLRSFILAGIIVTAGVWLAWSIVGLIRAYWGRRIGGTDVAMKVAFGLMPIWGLLIAVLWGAR